MIFNLEQTKCILHFFSNINYGKALSLSLPTDFSVFFLNLKTEFLAFCACANIPQSPVSASFYPPLHSPSPVEPNKSSGLLCLPQRDLALYCRPPVPAIKVFFPFSALASVLHQGKN